jgi:hypothetical protein
MPTDVFMIKEGCPIFAIRKWSVGISALENAILLTLIVVIRNVKRIVREKDHVDISVLTNVINAIEMFIKGAFNRSIKL